MRLLEQGLIGYPARSVDQLLVLEAVAVLAEPRWTLVPEQSSPQVADPAVLAELRWTLVPEQSSPQAAAVEVPAEPRWTLAPEQSSLQVAAEWMEPAQELY